MAGVNYILIIFGMIFTFLLVQFLFNADLLFIFDFKVIGNLMNNVMIHLLIFMLVFFSFGFLILWLLGLLLRLTGFVNYHRWVLHIGMNLALIILFLLLLLPTLLFFLLLALVLHIWAIALIFTFTSLSMIVGLIRIIFVS